jgi:hypothetical protein
VVNGDERGVAIRYSAELVRPRQAEAVNALEWMDAPRGVFVDNHQMGGTAWVYFVDERGGYTKVALTPDGDFIGACRCEEDRYNPVDDDYTGEFNLEDGDGYWPTLSDSIADSLPRT